VELEVLYATNQCVLTYQWHHPNISGQGGHPICEDRVMKGVSSEVPRSRSLQVNVMNVSKNCKARVIGKSIGAIRRTKQALYAAAAIHTIAPLLLLACLMIPFVVAAHG